MSISVVAVITVVLALGWAAAFVGVLMVRDNHRESNLGSPDPAARVSLAAPSASAEVEPWVADLVDFGHEHDIAFAVVSAEAGEPLLVMDPSDEFTTLSDSTRFTEVSSELSGIREFHPVGQTPAEVTGLYRLGIEEGSVGVLLSGFTREDLPEFERVSAAHGFEVIGTIIPRSSLDWRYLTLVLVTVAGVFIIVRMVKRARHGSPPSR